MVASEVDNEDVRRMDRVCEQLGMSRSEFLRRAVRDALPGAEAAAWTAQWSAVRQAIKMAACLVAKDAGEYESILEGLKRIEQSQAKRKAADDGMPLFKLSARPSD